MNWIFVLLLAVTLVLLLTPFSGVLPPEVSLIFWMGGSLFLLAVLLWIVATLSHPRHAEATSSIS